MEYNPEVLSKQYDVVSLFVHHLGYDRGLTDAWGSLQDHDSFWNLTWLGHLSLATIEWCKVFGSRDENLHWKKTPTGVSKEKVREDFRRRVLAKTGFTQEAWKDYHGNV